MVMAMDGKFTISEADGGARIISGMLSISAKVQWLNAGSSLNWQTEQLMDSNLNIDKSGDK